MNRNLKLLLVGIFILMGAMFGFPLTSNAEGGAISWTWSTTIANQSKSVYVKTTAATTIDWGDGTVDTVTVSSITEKYYSHTYTTAGSYTVTIADNVVKSLNLQAKGVNRLDVSGATALTDLQCAQNQLTTLDVSKNTALTTLKFFL